MIKNNNFKIISQIETDKRINELYRTGFPEYLTVTNPQEYILYTAMGKGFVESETDNLQISNTSLNFLQKRDVSYHSNHSVICLTLVVGAIL